MRTLLIVAPLLASILAAPLVAAAEWTVPGPRQFTAPAICSTDPDRAGRPVRPNQLSYRVCDDQMAIFRQALADARAAGKLLLVSFGATWCPWCATLQKHMAGPEVLGHRGGDIDLGAAFAPVEIALSTLDRGQKVDVPSGDDVLQLVLGKAPGARIRAIPFIAILDPADDGRVLARNIDDLASRSGDYDLARFRAILAEAEAVVRHGRSAPSEPGWLGRTGQRLWD